MEIIREIEIRCMGHRLANEHYRFIDNLLKISATLASAISASASFWTMMNDTLAMKIVMAGTATVTTIINAIIATCAQQNNANAHKEAARMLDNIKMTYVWDLVNTSIVGDKREDIIRKIRVDVSNVLKDAPVINTAYENRARQDLARRDDQLMSTPPSPHPDSVNLCIPEHIKQRFEDDKQEFIFNP